MSLYQDCVDLQVKLEAAQAADAGIELLAHGQRLVDTLEEITKYLESAANLPAELTSGSFPGVDERAVMQAVGAFRGGLSRHGVSTFQHQPAAGLIDVAKRQRDKCARWVASRWRAVFTQYEPEIERADSGQLVGDITQRVTAQSRASTLKAARGFDPIAQSGQLGGSLGGSNVDDWLHAIRTTASELHEALQRLDAARNEMAPEVRRALQRAASEDGLALSDLTDELLTALRAAGVDEQLVVRHQ